MSVEIAQAVAQKGLVNCPRCGHRYPDEGRMKGARRGGAARMALLSKAQRSELAKVAARARWARKSVA